ncbi:hypothetical protein BT96DRAFT_443309 [Gymnopus androsaceus JB14]|uniref:Uncharacterized protein n=1 Tax=Gymnopus androsaceus JB14 TaxID=1447944 RepID=A0A6A4GQV0_9AGAR|nr:hypothetical protein BT96DRAFT_443309 [Gymnopus androsaceus JB14]
MSGKPNWSDRKQCSVEHSCYQSWYPVSFVSILFCEYRWLSSRSGSSSAAAAAAPPPAASSSVATAPAASSAAAADNSAATSAATTSSSSTSTSGFALSNGQQAQALNAQFATLTTSSSSTSGQDACVNGGFAQCVNGSKCTDVERSCMGKAWNRRCEEDEGLWEGGEMDGGNDEEMEWELEGVNWTGGS